MKRHDLDDIIAERFGGADGANDRFLRIRLLVHW